MPDLLNIIESVPRRTMTLFFLIDKSGSMAGNKIGAVNDAIVNVLPMINDISDTNSDAEIKVAALEFSTSCQWLYSEPKLANEFIWQDVTAGGMTSLGEAFSELSSKLSRSGFMVSPSGSYAPAIILLSDGGPTDNYKSGLYKLQSNNWFKSAIKVAIAIGEDADKDVLKEFTGNVESVFTVHNIDALKQIIGLVAIKSVDIGSKSCSTGDSTKQDKVIEEIKNDIKNIDGAASADDDPYVDWRF